MRQLSWLGIARLGLVQMALGAMVVLCTSTLNRVMVVELSLPAIVPGTFVALHYAVQVLRPRMGFGADIGGRRTPWIVGGVAAMAVGAILAAEATCEYPAAPLLAAGGSLVGFLLLGLGVGAAGTSLLALVAQRTAPERRAAAATILWLMMIAGIAVTAGVSSRLLAPFSPDRLIAVTAGVAAVSMLLAVVATRGMEGGVAERHSAPATASMPFLRALQEIWAERQSRRFAQFVFVSMLAYSAQELLLEPLAGGVFGLSPAQTAGLTGLQHAGVLLGMALVAVGTVSGGGYGRRAMRLWTVGGCVASAAGTLAIALLCLADNAAILQAAVFGLGAANGAFAVSAIGAMMGLAAEGRSGRDGTRIGLWGAAQALAFGAGGLLGTGASDLARTLLGGPAASYALVFGLESVAFLMAAWLAAGLFGAARRPAPLKKWGIEVHQ